MIRLGADIALIASLTYTGAQPLRLEGRGQTLSGPASGDALVVTGGADIALQDLTIRNAGGHGVYLELPAEATGIVRVELRGVRLLDNELSGLWIEDQIHNSAAGIGLTILQSRVSGNGYRAGAEWADYDGVRVNEGGLGSLGMLVRGSSFTGNAADGLELDERGPGDVVTRVQQSHFDDNGDQPQDPSDLEDGFDIDEEGGGSIYAWFTHVSANRNQDEGIDLDEEGAGDIYVVMNQVTVVNNRDHNLTMDEDADEVAGGSIIFEFRNLNASSSQIGDGMRIREYGPGDLEGRITRSRINDNADDGIQIESRQLGSGALRLKQVVIEGNADQAIATNNVQVIQVGQP